MDDCAEMPAESVLHRVKAAARRQERAIYKIEGEKKMEEKTERIIQENKAFCEATEENGVEVCSWEEMPGHKSFVNGEITESQLTDQVREEMARFAQTFSKYMVVNEDASAREKESDRRRKAKVANKIYKKACTDSGKSLCFFKNFTSWQEFVEGNIGDDELYAKAVEEARKLAENTQG